MRDTYLSFNRMKVNVRNYSVVQGRKFVYFKSKILIEEVTNNESTSYCLKIARRPFTHLVRKLNILSVK
jgi:hypothetical protein